jgi:peroxiredoxin Q/BCP
MSELLREGTEAPDFRAEDQDGNPISLSGLRGQIIILYFYPRDDTPGCTREACGFRDDLSAFEREGAKVVGVSVDDRVSHKRFQEKHGLNFTLVADPGKEVTRLYGALGILGVARRVTYIIDGEGVIRRVYEKVRTRDHSREVVQAIREISKAR